MKRKEPLLINEIIHRMIESTGMRPDLARHTAEAMWPKVVGESIAAYTGRLYIKDRVMHAYITSASLKEELGYARASLTERINEAVGGDVIDDIILH